MTPPAAARRGTRGFWLKQLHAWHWISAAASLVGMLLFAVTGITLNHAGSIEARPRVQQRTGILPAGLMGELAPTATPPQGVPPALRDWLAREWGIDAAVGRAEWQGDELYVALPRPGGDAFLTIDRRDGALLYERTDRGWIAYLNDLHKGRNAGRAWAWFIDVFAAACVLFSVTGLLLLQLHARHRPLTWPLVGAGLAVPALVALVFIH